MIPLKNVNNIFYPKSQKHNTIRIVCAFKKYCTNNTKLFVPVLSVANVHKAPGSAVCCQCT